MNIISAMNLVRDSEVTRYVYEVVPHQSDKLYTNIISLNLVFMQI